MEDGAYTYTIDEALLSVGFGKFQTLMLAYVGIGQASDAMEMMLLSFVGPSVRTEWGISGRQESLISSVVFAGMLIGSFIWGYVSDNYGRRTGFLFTAVITSLAGFASAFAPNYICLLVLRFIVGFGLGGAHVLGSWFLEFIPTSNRGIWMLVVSSFWTAGTILQAAVAWVVMPMFGWRWLVALSSLPSSLMLVFYKHTPESPRYLLRSDKTDEAMLVLTKIALMNEAFLPPGLLGSNYLEEDYASSSNAGLSESSPLITTKGRDRMKVFFDLFSPKLVRSTLLLWIVFFGNGFGYYGVVLLTSELSAGTGKCNSNLTKEIHLQDDSSLYKDVFLTSIAGIPAFLLAILAIDKVGRKASMYIMLFSCCAFLAPLVRLQKEIITTALLFGARACVSGSYDIVFVYAREVYPTSVRSTGLGVASAIARIGGMLCPIVAVSLIENCWQTEAILLLDLIIFAAGVATTLFSQETKGQDLAD